MRVWDDVRSRLKPVLAAYAVLGASLWFVPVLNVLHVESAAVVALVAFFAAGLSSVGWFRAVPVPVGRVLAAQEAALGVPLAMLTVTLPWVPNCGYGIGLLFFALFPVVSVVLAVALAYALTAAPVRRPGRAFVLIGLAVAVLGPLYDLGLHPQFYVYNHVFGGVLGPIYDEELAIRPGLFVFRAMTLGWAGWLGVAGRWLRLRRQGAQGRREAVCGGLLALGLGTAYLFSGPLGINTPEAYLQRSLGGHLRTPHFDLYFDPESIAESDLLRLVDAHEYRYAWLAERLGVTVPERIASYLYPDADTKARLTGARATNVAPVWLARPQVHVLLEDFDDVFGHELVHVFSRTFGLPVLRASVSVGLVEGLAVALEPPDGRPTPHEQVLAVALKHAGGDPSKITLAEDVAARLSPQGFWTGRGAVSYTTMGSFVRYLIDTYGVAAFRQVYAWADFERVYGQPVERLAAGWQAHLLAVPVVARASAHLATRRFAVPSLFEKPCPHHVPAYRRHDRAARAALARADTVGALAHLDAALARRPDYAPSLDLWAVLRLAQGVPADVVARLDTLARAPVLALRLGDAYAMLGQTEQARDRYEAAWRWLPLYAHEARALVVLRNALAPYPGIVRILTSGVAPAGQADRLAAWRDRSPAAALMEALRRAEAGQVEQALALLRTTPAAAVPAATADRQATLARQHPVWMARFAYRAGDLLTARAAALRAARAFREAGDLNAAAHLEDRADLLDWRLRRTPAVSPP